MKSALRLYGGRKKVMVLMWTSEQVKWIFDINLLNGSSVHVFSIDFIMLLSLGNIFQVWQSGCTRMLDWFFCTRCSLHYIKTENRIFGLFVAFKDTMLFWTTGDEQNNESKTSHSIRFESMKLEIPIIHAMKYDHKLKCASHLHEAWSMTHIGFNISKIYSKLICEKHFCLCPTWNTSTPLCPLSLLLDT